MTDQQVQHASTGEITALVKAELVVLGQFVDVLTREQDALTGGHTDSLMVLAEEKVRYAEQLATMSKSRDATLRNAGFGEGAVGMKALRAASTIPVAVQADLQTLIQLAQEARRLNDLNGQLVAERMQNNQQALNVLLDATRQSSLYGPDGQTHAGVNARTSGRTLGSA